MDSIENISIRNTDWKTAEGDFLDPGVGNYILEPHQIKSQATEKNKFSSSNIRTYAKQK